VGKHGKISGLDQLDKVIAIDQKPIGRTPRSNPGTYTKAFDQIRNVFAELPEARTRGYKAGRFSFNVKGGRCEACEGDGVVKVEMHFLSDVYVPCEVCNGRRYNVQTLGVRFKGHSIADVLDLSIEDCRKLFENHPGIVRILDTPATLKGPAGSNYCDISLVTSKDDRRVVVMSSIDNLLKGQSGVAMQNINLMFGLDETAEAVGALEEAVRLAPADASARLGLALALQAAGRAAEAVEELDEALRLDPAVLEGRPAARAALQAARRGEPWP